MVLNKMHIKSHKLLRKLRSLRMTRKYSAYYQRMLLVKSGIIFLLVTKIKFYARSTDQK